MGTGPGPETLEPLQPKAVLTVPLPPCEVGTTVNLQMRKARLREVRVTLDLVSRMGGFLFVLAQSLRVQDSLVYSFPIQTRLELLAGKAHVH